MKNKLNRVFVALALLALPTLNSQLSTAYAQGTTITYQGRLNTNGVPANGFFDFKFALYTNSAGTGTQIGSTQTQPDVGVTNGLFNVTLDFGSGIFTGNPTWMEISTRSNGVGSYVALTPLQPLDPAPYAIFANTASNLSGTLPAGDLSGTYPDAVTLNNGANVFVGNGHGLTDLNAANLSGTLSDSVLPADVALLDAASQTFTGSNVFNANGHSFIIDTGGAPDTNLFTGLSIQYWPGQGESSFQSSYNDGFASVSFWTKQGGSSPIDRQVFIDRYGNVGIDNQNANNGVFNDGSTNGVGLVFGIPSGQNGAGGASGEGIASERQPGGNQFGLDFYTAFNNRLAIRQNGNVGIGLTNPATALQVNGIVTAIGFAGPIALSQLPSQVVVENENGVTLDNMIIAGTLDLPFPATIEASGTHLLEADANDNFYAGFDAGAVAGTGAYNTGIGDFAMEFNLSGSNNVAVGFNAMSAAATGPDLTGSGNTAVGSYALANDNPGYNNTGVGYFALQNNTNGFENVAVGVEALQHLNSGSENYDNTAVGAYAFQTLTSGIWNTAVGEFSLPYLTNGILNLALGLEAGYYLTSGSDNIYLGSYGVQGDNNVMRLGASPSETYVNGATTYLTGSETFVDGLLYANNGVMLDGTDTNYGMVYVPSGMPGISSGNGPFLYGYNGGALGGLAPTTICLSWDYSGDIWVSNNCSTKSLTIRGGSDLAEPFEISPDNKEVPEGSVVVIDKKNPGHLKVSSQPYDTRVAGVLSGANGIHAGIQMQQDGVLEAGRNVALSGRVYVQADASNGAIEPGDLLTTSSTPGRAMKVTDHARAQGAILGKAMTGLSEGSGMVLVLVTLQ